MDDNSSASRRLDASTTLEQATVTAVGLAQTPKTGGATSPVASASSSAFATRRTAP